MTMETGTTKQERAIVELLALSPLKLCAYTTGGFSPYAAEVEDIYDSKRQIIKGQTEPEFFQRLESAVRGAQRLRIIELGLQLKRREQANQELSDRLTGALAWVEALTHEVVQRCAERDEARYQGEDLMWLLASVEDQRDILRDSLAALADHLGDDEDELVDGPGLSEFDALLRFEARDEILDELLDDARQSLDLVEGQ